MRLAEQEDKHAARWSERIAGADRTRARSEGSRARPLLVPAHLRSERRAAPPRAGGEQGRSRIRPADGAAERSDRSADRRGGDARGARSRRRPAHAGRRQRCRRRDRRSTRFSRRERWHVRGTGWIGDAIYGVNDGLGAVFGIVSGMAGYTGGSEVVLAAGLAGTLASALSMGAGAYLASKSRARGVRIGSRARAGRDRRGPARRAARARAVLPAQGVLGRRSARDGRAAAEGAEAVSAHAGARGARAVGGDVSRTRGARRCRRRVSTAIGGFIPIIPFFFTVGMPAVIASFIISTRRALRGRRVEGAGHDAAVVGQRRRDDGRRHHRSGDHLRPRASRSPATD